MLRPWKGYVMILRTNTEKSRDIIYSGNIVAYACIDFVEHIISVIFDIL